ncbi:hypothetical protein [Planctomyces sp. SH-PL62]|uniref:hypothetical protein n=1 Tax=Planctomyces sp. SH-PL62 TaxID=1636152 RepID=UPI00078CECB9|nr:hypothetical protein [Planctomyces sp. SH-PL62]AMV37855.1 hypothetical protein VT85_10485 [Planctomyces sp. SH-PL62]
MWSNQRGLRAPSFSAVIAIGIVVAWAAESPVRAEAGVKASDVASWPIVVAADAAPAERRAAEELRDAFAEATGRPPRSWPRSRPGSRR